MDQILLDAHSENQESTAFKTAGFFRRWIAYLLDFIFMIVLIYIPFFLFKKETGVEMVIKNITYYAIFNLYKPLFEYYLQATPGKLLLKLRVLGKDFNKLTLGQSFIRYSPWLIGMVWVVTFEVVSKINPGVALKIVMLRPDAAPQNWIALNVLRTIIRHIVPVISALWIITNRKRLAFHDIIAKSQCLRRIES